MSFRDLTGRVIRRRRRRAVGPAGGVKVTGGDLMDHDRYVGADQIAYADEDVFWEFPGKDPDACDYDRGAVPGLRYFILP